MSSGVVKELGSSGNEAMTMRNPTNCDLICLALAMVIPTLLFAQSQHDLLWREVCMEFTGENLSLLGRHKPCWRMRVSSRSPLLLGSPGAFVVHLRTECPGLGLVVLENLRSSR